MAADAALAAQGLKEPAATPSVYFCGSVRGGRADLALFTRIVSRLRRFGTVLTEHVAAPTMDTAVKEVTEADKIIHNKDMALLKQANVVVAEVTQPSLGVGYELGQAVAFKKQVLCLFRPKSGRVLSATIRGAANGTLFQVWDYEEEEIEGLLEHYFNTYFDPSMTTSNSTTVN